MFALIVAVVFRKDLSGQVAKYPASTKEAYKPVDTASFQKTLASHRDIEAQNR